MRGISLLSIVLVLLAVNGCASSQIPASRTIGAYGESDRRPAQTAQNNPVDDECFVAYSRAIGQCNANNQKSDAQDTACLAPMKRQLKDCCRQTGASSQCAADSVFPAQQEADYRCYSFYIQESESCKARGKSYRSYAACLVPIKRDLRRCCIESKGSSECAGEAQ